MDIYQKIVVEIHKYIDKLDKDEEFKRNNPNITATEYLISEIDPDIKPQRLKNILEGKTKRISLQEVCIICYWLNIEVTDLFKDID